MTLDAYLLTRQWRDTRHGIELSLWASSDRGPVNIVIPAQKAVCFIERDQALDLPYGVHRKPLDLTLLHGQRVDGLYFSQQRQLQQLRQLEVPLNESDIKPADRFLMERFIRAGFTIEGNLTQENGFLRAHNPRLSPSDYQPRLKSVSIDIETRGHSRQLYSIAAATLVDDAQADSAEAGQRTLQTNSPANVVFMVGELDNACRSGCTDRLGCGQL